MSPSTVAPTSTRSASCSSSACARDRRSPATRPRPSRWRGCSTRRRARRSCGPPSRGDSTQVDPAVPRARPGGALPVRRRAARRAARAVVAGRRRRPHRHRAPRPAVDRRRRRPTPASRRCPTTRPSAADAEPCRCTDRGCARSLATALVVTALVVAFLLFDHTDLGRQVFGQASPCRCDGVVHPDRVDRRRTSRRSPASTPTAPVRPARTTPRCRWPSTASPPPAGRPSRYNDRHFGNLKPGVGLILDARPTAARSARSTSPSPTQGWAASVYESAGAVRPDDARRLGQPGRPAAGDRGATTSFDLARPHRRRYVLLWITDLGDGPPPCGPRSTSSPSRAEPACRASASGGRRADRPRARRRRPARRPAPPSTRSCARHYDRVYALCRRITGNDHDALDATQDALIAIVRGLPRYDGRAAFSTWAYRVTTNACLDELRRRRRRPTPDARPTTADLDDADARCSRRSTSRPPTDDASTPRSAELSPRVPGRRRAARPARPRLRRDRRGARPAGRHRALPHLEGPTVAGHVLGRNPADARDPSNEGEPMTDPTRSPTTSSTSPPPRPSMARRCVGPIAVRRRPPRVEARLAELRAGDRGRRRARRARRRPTSRRHIAAALAAARRRDPSPATPGPRRSRPIGRRRAAIGPSGRGRRRGRRGGRGARRAGRAGRCTLSGRRRRAPDRDRCRRQRRRRPTVPASLPSRAVTPRRPGSTR